LIPDMPRPRPPHLQHEKTRHGNYVWVVRIGKGPRKRLKAAYGTPEFDAEYQAAITGQPLAAKPGASKASLQWLWDSYRETGAWTGLALSTRRQRENIMLHVLKDSGAKPYAAIGPQNIQDGLDRRSKTPAAARNFLDTMKGLFRWAKKRKHVKTDPTADSDIDAPKKKKGKGFPAWTRQDVEAYRRRWPLGTRQYVWLDVLLYTGPRRGDAAIIGRQHEKDIRNEDGSMSRVVQFKTEKSGELVTVTIPILAPLRRTLDKGPTGDLTWICGARGRPFTKESFGNEFSQAARQAGVKKSAHGVRKIAATIAAENGATVHELMALFGWTTIQQAEVYTREASRARLSAGAAHKLDETGTSMPAPSGVVRAKSEKA
jgi:site-specific recombinase XerD